MTSTVDRVVEQAGTPTTSIAWDGSGLLMCRPELNEIWRWDAETDTLELYRKYTGAARALAVSAGGRIYGCQTPSRRIIEYIDDGSARTLNPRLDGHYHNCPVSLATDKQERIWFADAHVDVKSPGPNAYPRLDHASVLRLEPGPDDSWQLRRMTTDTKNPLALALAMDEETLYVVDIAGSRTDIYAYEVDPHAGLGKRRPVFGLEAQGDHPMPGISTMPGLSTTRDGNLLLAGVGGRHDLRLIDPDGHELETIVLDDEPTLAIQSASDDSTVWVATRSGAVLRVKLDSLS